MKKMIPLGRFGTPDDIGQLSVFLAYLASYITGTLVVADGGQNLGGSGADADDRGGNGQGGQIRSGARAPAPRERRQQ